MLPALDRDMTIEGGVVVMGVMVLCWCDGGAAVVLCWCDGGLVVVWCWCGIGAVVVECLCYLHWLVI